MFKFIVISILFAHWFSDFVCQSDKMALNKSGSMFWLTVHASVYSAAFWGMISLLCWSIIPWQYVVFNGACHWVIDFFTSRLNKHLWNEKKVHWFFVSVGYDQWLHMALLVATWGVWS